MLRELSDKVKGYLRPKTADTYRYKTLPTASHIRYLLLQPGEGGDPIICSLHVTKLEDPTPFEAISYVWGTSERTEPIECDGKTLYVTVNLRDSLLAVRRPDEGRALWSDSICINQADNREKGQQVSLMAEIYRKSTCTLICLGPNDGGGHAEAAAGIITAANQMMDKAFEDKDFSWEPNSFPSPSADDPMLSDPRWESVAILIDQPWFNRLWVVQEAALSPVAEIIWSGVHIDWSHFLRADYWTSTKGILVEHNIFHDRVLVWIHLASFQMRRPRESRALETVGFPQSCTLLQLLDMARGLGATDPRDRIFACLSLPHSTTFHGPQLAALKPDYNKAHVQVYHDFACAYLEATRMDLDLLGFVQHTSYYGFVANCPSWVPHWDNNYCSTPYKTSARRHSSQFPSRVASNPCLVDRNTLKVRGLQFGSVQHVTRMFTEGMALETIGTIWQEVERLGDSSQIGQNPYHASARQAFVSTLAAANFPGDLVEWSNREIAYMDYVQRRTTQQENKTIPSARVEEEDEETISSAVEVHQVIMRMAHNRKLIVSDRGYYGLASSAAQRGDVIFIIFGTKSPFILRKDGGTSLAGATKYKLVGDVLMLSAFEVESGIGLPPVGFDESYDDWRSWGLQEQDILIC